MTQAAFASSRNVSAQTHAKIDNTDYTYIGRSCGIGSFVGLESIESTTTLLRYCYFENGYQTSVMCIKNGSAVYGLELYMQTDDPYLPFVYQATGMLPNSNWTIGQLILAKFYAISTANSSSSAFSLLGTDVANRYIWQIVPGFGYAMFEDVQCEASFVPTKFQVDVNPEQKTLLVSSITENPKAYNIDSTGSIWRDVFHQPWAFAAIVHPVMGEVFVSRVQNVAAKYNQTSSINATLPSGNTSTSNILQGTAEAYESILDNALLIFGMAQIIVVNTTSSTPGYNRSNRRELRPRFIYLRVIGNLSIDRAAVHRRDSLHRVFDGFAELPNH